MEKTKINFNGLIGELFGTMLLVLFGAGIASRGDSLWTGSIAFGLILMVLIVTLGPLSGGNFNPAVSIGLLINKKLDLKNFLLYVLAQIVGAIIGGALLLLIFRYGNNIGANNLGTGYLNPLEAMTAPKYYGHDETTFMIIALVVELISTFAFVLTIILTVTSEKMEKLAVFIIPAALTLALLMTGVFTGGSVNPARSLGTMIFSDSIQYVWIVIVGPVLGAIAAGFVGLLINKRKTKDEVAKELAS